MKCLAALLVCAWCAAAEPPSEIDGLIDQARALPGEFAADALIRIAGGANLADNRKIALLAQAYERAAEAQQPYKRRAAVHPAGYAMTFFNRAYEQELDGLSLRLRAIEAMLPLDGRRARQMFLDIGYLQLPPVTCEDYLVYDVSRYYSVLGRVAEETFSAEEVRRNEPVHLLLRFTGTIGLAVEVGPAARAIAAARVRDEDFQSLVTGFAGALGRISGDDRSFAGARADFEIQALVQECRKRRVSPLPLLEGYRLYLVTNLGGKRCADSELAAQGGRAGDLVSFFNESLETPPVQAIQPDEAVPASVEGRAKLPASCEEGACQGIQKLYEGLILGENGVPYPTGYRASSEFRTKLRDSLNTLAALRGDAGSGSAEQYGEISSAFNAIYGIVPTSADRDEVATAMLECLSRNRLRSENIVEWFLPLDTLIWRVVAEPDLKGLVRRFLDGADPVVAFYTRLESAMPRTPDRVMPLL
jgi:hypothetical protein